MLWTPGIVDACSISSGKARLFVTVDSTATRALLAWGDARSDANDIYAQCVNLDGSLGNPGDVDDDGTVDIDDLLGVINAWGACPPPPTFCPSDLAPPPMGNGQVDVDDLLKVIGHWD